MRVLLINETWGLTGGQEEYILQVGNGLSSRGHDVRLIFGKFSGKKEGTERAQFKTEEVAQLTARKVLETTRRFRADVVNLQNVFEPNLVNSLNQEFPTTRFVHDHSTYCPGNSKYFFNSGKICTIATSAVCFLNAYKEKCMTRRPLLAVKRIGQRQTWLSALKSLPVVLCNSHYLKERLVQNGLDEEKIIVNHLFPGHSGQISKIEGREKTAEILYVGRLFKEKGVDLLLRAVSRLRSKFLLKIVGEGWERENLIELSRQLKIGERVEFLGFKVGSDLERLYRECAFFVLPSVWPEPFGIVGLEAHLFKKPVVAFNVGGVPDWLENGVNGFLLEEVSPAALAEKMEILLNSPDLGKKMGEAGFKKVKDQFNLDRHLDVLEQVYFDLTDRRHD